jgi:hypothetical protein
MNTTTLTRETEMPAKKTTPKVADTHVTPRRIVTMSDDLWLPLGDLAHARHTTSAALVREAVRLLINEARATGELPKVKRSTR